MASSDKKSDKHFPLWAHDSLIRRIFSNPKKYCSYVSNGQMIADLGCGPGFYTLPLAECVGNEGKVYAVDSDIKAIQTLEKKADKRCYHNIEAHASSASDLGFIKDGSVDFVLADGLVCSMAPKHHESAVKEIKRILKPNGKVYLKVARGFYSYVDYTEWVGILGEFNIKQKSDGSIIGDRWALVSKKQQ